MSLPFKISLLSVSRWGTADAEIEVTCAEKTELSVDPSLKPGADLDWNLVYRTARNCRAFQTAFSPRKWGRVHRTRHCSAHLISSIPHWGTTDDFATSFLHFSLFSSALWNLANSRPVHSLMLSSHLFLCLPCLFPAFTVPCEMVLARPDKGET